jgi:uncharacterized protein YxeA
MELIEFAKEYCTVIFSGINNSNIKTLYPFQIEYLKSLQNNRFTHTTKSRQVLGMSTILAIYCAWFLLFYKNEKPGLIAIISPKRESSCNLLSKVQVIIDAYIAKHSNISQIKNVRAKKQLSNNNMAIAIGNTVDGLCSFSTDVIVIDDAAYIPDLKEIIAAALPSLIKHGQIHLNSTPNGINHFYEIKMDNDNHFFKQDYHYSLNPSAKQFVEQMKKSIYSQNHWDQEMELKFVPSNSTPKDKILQFRIDNQMLSQLNERLLTIDLSLSDYIRGLIKQDLLR